MLVIFILATSLYVLDYKSGQANQLISKLSPEVVEALEKAQEGINSALGKIRETLAPILEKLKIQEILGKVQESLAPALDQLKTLLAKATDGIEELSEKCKMGEKTLADYLFAARRQVRK